MPGRSRRPKRISAMRRPTSSRTTTRKAARRASASSRPTAKACSIASAPGSPRPARTSSMRGSTRRATAWRSTICWCTTAADKPYADRRLRKRLAGSIEAALAGKDAAARAGERAEPAAVAEPSRSPPRSPSPSARRPGRRWSRSTRATAQRLLAALARDPRRGSAHPFGAHRDLWRARGRRLLPDAAPTAKTGGRRRGGPRIRAHAGGSGARKAKAA